MQRSRARTGALCEEVPHARSRPGRGTDAEVLFRAALSWGRPAANHRGGVEALLRDAVPLLSPVLVVILGCVAASQGDQGRIGEWGLIQALPWTYFLSVGLLSCSFFVQLGRHRQGSESVLGVHLAGLVLLLHGAPALLEQLPRFATAWLHVGFAGQILTHHVAPGGVEARFNWPGFFGAAASVTGAGGMHDALPLLRWAPVCMVLLYLLPLYVIGRQLTGSSTATWLGLWFFVLVNWVGQDYFAPQTLGFVLYLLTIAIIVTYFRQPLRARAGTAAVDGSQEAPPGHRWMPFDGFPDLAAGPRLRLGLLAVLLLLTAALSMTHQLSPILLVLATGALVLVGRFRLTVFPLVAGVLVLGWISVGTTAYWVGHLGTIFGGVGDVQGVVSNSVGERIGGSAGHLGVVKIRLALTAVVWLSMGVSTLVLWLRRRPPLTLFTLGVVPFLTLAQDYGNEGVLRIFLFSSPFAALLAGQAVTSTLHRRWMKPGVALVSLLLVPLFVTTRYGNESFEQVRADEVAAIRLLYRVAPRGSELISPTSQLPWRFAHAVDYDYGRPTHAAAFLAGKRAAVRYPVGSEGKKAAGTYVVFTTSQLTYAYEALGQHRDWFRRLEPELTRANGYRLIFRNQDALIYEYEAPR